MRDRLRIFIGVDRRQPVAYSVLRSSIERHASRPVDIQPLRIEWMPVKRTGLTEFSYSRYLVPLLCNYEGSALFMDADMICLDDIYKLQDICRAQEASVCVVKNKRRFEWGSLMYFTMHGEDGAVDGCEGLTAEVVASGTPQDFKWASVVAEIPSEWNHLVGYDTPREDAKIVHFTQGIPIWDETRNCEYAAAWQEEYLHTVGSVSFKELMGPSVHIPHMKSAVPA